MDPGALSQENSVTHRDALLTRESVSSVPRARRAPESMPPV